MTGIFRGSGSTSTATEEFNIDGDKGDIVVTNSGDTWTIDTGVVNTTKLGGDITTAGKALLDDANASAQRTTLGLGTLAVQNGTFSGTFSGTSSNTNTGDQNLFQTIAVSGQSDVVADSTTDTLNLVAGINVTITTDPLTDSITIASASASGVPDGDKGDIVVSTSGTVWTIDNDVVTYAKIQDVSTTDKLLGRSTAGSGNVEEIDCTAAGRALLDDVDSTAQRATLGLGNTSTLDIGTTAGTVAAGDDSRINNGQTAFGWGDHAVVGYLESADIGVSVQAWDDDLDTWATKTAPTGVVVGDADTQTLSNKTIDGSSNTITNISLSTGVVGTLSVANGGTGASTLSANNVLLGNGTSAVQAVAPSTSGNVLTSNGTTWVSSAAPSTSAFPAGTRMTFNQTSAPTGWTKDTTAGLNDSIMRIVTGTVGSGGSNAFSTFNGQTSVGATTLSTAQIPSHTHGLTGYVGNSNSGLALSSFHAAIAFNAVGSNTGAQGGGGSHTHTITTAIKYNDFIIASKD